jgi:hypothetical protein
MLSFGGKTKCIPRFSDPGANFLANRKDSRTAVQRFLLTAHAVFQTWKLRVDNSPSPSLQSVPFQPSTTGLQAGASVPKFSQAKRTDPLPALPFLPCGHRRLGQQEAPPLALLKSTRRPCTKMRLCAGEILGTESVRLSPPPSTSLASYLRARLLREISSKL